MAGIREEIAKNLLFYRKKCGLTQKALADRLGVKNTAVSNWESGNNSIDIDTLVNACDIFGVTLNDMYGKFSSPSHTLNYEEEQLVDNYRSLNPDGQEKLLEYSTDLVASRRYLLASSVSAG